MVDGKKVYLAKSNQLHVAMKNAKKTNAKNVTVNKTNVTLKAGKTFVIKSSTKLENAKKKQLLHADAYRYYTSDKKLAGLFDRRKKLEYQSQREDGSFCD